MKWEQNFQVLLNLEQASFSISRFVEHPTKFCSKKWYFNLWLSYYCRLYVYLIVPVALLGVLHKFYSIYISNRFLDNLYRKICFLYCTSWWRVFRLQYSTWKLLFMFIYWGLTTKPIKLKNLFSLKQSLDVHREFLKYIFKRTTANSIYWLSSNQRCTLNAQDIMSADITTPCFVC